jgi:hypothetical protein
MLRSSAAAVLAVLVFVPMGLTEDKAEVKKPLGTWVREAGNNKVAFTFEADTLTCVVTGGGGEVVTVQAAYSVTEDTLFGVVTKVEEKGGARNAPEKGDLFSFHFKVEKDMLTLDKMKTTIERPESKQLVQGEYRKGKAK